jgi:hypothetical protein
MPQSIYNMVKDKKRFEMSHVKMTTHGERNYSGQDVQRNEYDWGDRLQGADDPNMEGMVRMEGQVEGGKMRTGGYFTFRVISAQKPRDWNRRPHKKSWEDSWVKPAMPARPVTRAVIDVTRKPIEQAIEGAIRGELGI